MDKSRIRILSINTVIGLAIAGIAWWGWSALHPAPAETTSQTAIASLGDVSSSVAASGKVVSPGDVGVSPISSAQITSIRVKVGQHVNAGTVMATLDSSNAATALTNAKATLASDQIKFSQYANAINQAQQSADTKKPGYQQAIDVAQSALTTAQSTYTNYGLYFAKGVTISYCQSLSGIDVLANAQGCTGLINYYNSYQSALNTYNNAVAAQTTGLANDQLAIKSAQDTYNLFKIQMGVNTDAPTEADFKVDQTALANAQKNYDSMFVKAPVSGDVASISAVVGQIAPTASSSTVGAVSGFIVLTNVSNLEVQASFSESDAAKLIPGQQATFTFSALPNAEANGKLISVDLLPTSASGATSYGATFAIAGKVPGLKAGMTATVTDLTSAISNVLQVPSAAVTIRGSGAFVNVVTSSGGKESLVRTPVTVGLQGDASVQILSGIKAGTKVSISSSKSSVGSNGFPSVGGLGVPGGIGGGGFGGGRG
jgi:membrane fusion protein, macrolide-specific efflux system